jgi:hypothetical protein
VARKIYQNLAFLDTKDGDENENNAIIEETSDEASGGGGGEQYYHPGSIPVTVMEEESEGAEPTEEAR